jgi:hypothetical protein
MICGRGVNNPMCLSAPDTSDPRGDDTTLQVAPFPKQMVVYLFLSFGAEPPACISGETEATAFSESVLPLSLRCDGAVN